MESSTSVLERLLAQSESDFSAIPGGKKEVIFMHVSGMLDTGALQILRRKETTEDSGKMTRPELLEWLRTQDLGTPTMIQSAREAQTLADDVLRQHREDEAQKNRDAAATFNGREQEVQRARHRESLIGKSYPNSEPVGIRIPVKKNGKTYYELVDPAGVGVNEGFLTTGTPTSGPEKNKCTVAKVASHFGLDADWLLKINQEVYTNLGGVEEQFKAGTLLWLEEDPIEEPPVEGSPVKSPEVLLFREKKRLQPTAHQPKSVDPRPSGGADDIAAVVGALVDRVGLDLDSPIKKRLGLGKFGSARPSDDKVPPGLSDEGGGQMTTQEAERRREGIGNTQTRIDESELGRRVKGNTGADSSRPRLNAMQICKPKNQSLETRVNRLERRDKVPVFRSPEAMYTHVNDLIADDPHMTPEEKLESWQENINRRHNMRAYLDANDLGPEAVARVMRIHSIKLLGGDEDAEMKALEAATNDEAKKERKEIDRRARAQTTAQGEPGGLAAMLQTALEGVRPPTRRPSTWVPPEDRVCFGCHKKGHQERDCPERHRGVGGRGGGEGGEARVRFRGGSPGPDGRRGGH